MSNVIRGSIRFPHTILTATLLVVLFGVLAMQRIPLQMRPSVDKPEITVTTQYRGASPEEVEDKITRPLEEALNAVEGVNKLVSASVQGRSRITLEFDWDVDRGASMVDVLNKLGRASRLPEEASSPIVEAISSDTTSPMMWIGLQTTRKDRAGSPREMRNLVEDIISPRLRRVEGVGSLIISGGQEREVQILIDLARLAHYKIPMRTLISTLREAHLTVRGGPLKAGKREYLVWTSGRANSTKALSQIVLRRTSTGLVTLQDVARTKVGHKRVTSLMHLNGTPAIALGVLRKTSANVPATAKKLEEALKELNKGFKQRGIKYKLRVLFTEVTYINQSLSLVQNNLILGAILAVVVLLLFLGSFRAVFVIALSIPVSVIAVFIVIQILGRSLNIVSLAGLAFAVGMVVDNAIVVLENIFRYFSTRKELDVEESCYRGTREVALAISASTLTTVAVFLPLLFLQTEAGQIFKDIALAISFAVGFSLLVSLTFIPMLGRLFLKKDSGNAVGSGAWTSFTERIGSKSVGLYQWSLNTFLGEGKAIRRFALCLIAGALFLASLTLLPPAEYLPSGNRNLIITLAKPLPGMNLQKVAAAAAPYEKFLLQMKERKRIFTVFNPRFNAIGLIVKDEYSDEKSMNRILRKLRFKAFSMPGFRFMFPIRTSIFRSPGKQFEVELTGPDLKRLQSYARTVTRRLRGLPGVIRVRSNFEEGALSVRVYPERKALREKGLSAYALAQSVQVALGGIRVGYYLDRGREVDLTLVGPRDAYHTPAGIRGIPLISAQQQLIYLGAVARVKEERAPTAINRIEMLRSIKLTVNLARKAPLGAVLAQAEKKILAPMRTVLPTEYGIQTGDTADRLNETLRDVSMSFLLALLISYLLMVALFRSFLYPFLIMAAVPMAATGAFVAIGVTGTSFDTITMLGFIILAGIVVNNAILIVHQTLHLQREGMPFGQALQEGATSRLRPIIMTATTSILGMLPLAMGSGAGTELYRGLGIAIVGGLALSTLVTLFLVPALMGLIEDLKGVFRKTPTSE